MIQHCKRCKIGMIFQRKWRIASNSEAQEEVLSVLDTPGVPMDMVATLRLS